MFIRHLGEAPSIHVLYVGGLSQIQVNPIIRGRGMHPELGVSCLKLW